MKNAFIRSKRNAAALMDDRQTTPNECAEDKVEFAADDLAHGRPSEGVPLFRCGGWLSGAIPWGGSEAGS